MKKTLIGMKPTKKVAKKAPVVTYDKPVKIGAVGPEVEWICTKLQEKGSTVKVTDKFHIGVRSAVFCFQKKNNLKPTGIVDKKTWDKLNK